MKTEYRHFIPLSEMEKDKIWNDCYFFYDTNVLINCYRYSPSSALELLKAIQDLHPKSKLPRQVADEFFSVREHEIKNQINRHHKFKDAVTEIDSYISNKKMHPFISNNAQSSLKSSIDVVLKEIKESEDALTSLHDNDQYLEKVFDIFNENLLPGFDKRELDVIFSDGEKRYNNKIPPGFKDSGKGSGDNQDCFFSKKRRFGDLIIWKEIIAFAKDNKSHIIFVMDDKKDDWWSKVNGKTKGILPYLRKEFYDETGKEILLYSSESFLSQAKHYKKSNPSQKTINEARDVASLLRRFSHEFGEQQPVDLSSIETNNNKLNEIRSQLYAAMNHEVYNDTILGSLARDIEENRLSNFDKIDEVLRDSKGSKPATKKSFNEESND